MKEANEHELIRLLGAISCSCSLSPDPLTSVRVLREAIRLELNMLPRKVASSSSPQPWASHVRSGDCVSRSA
eukprot:394515-Hanusia_phi.AAC.2